MFVQETKFEIWQEKKGLTIVDMLLLGVAHYIEDMDYLDDLMYDYSVTTPILTTKTRRRNKVWSTETRRDKDQQDDQPAKKRTMPTRLKLRRDNFVQQGLDETFPATTTTTGVRTTPLHPVPSNERLLQVHGRDESNIRQHRNRQLARPTTSSENERRRSTTTTQLSTTDDDILQLCAGALQPHKGTKPTTSCT
eukprot:1539166-Amphidinium_carterae.1